MKRVSTVVAKQSGNISQQKLTVGLDLGDRNSWYCVVDEAGQIQLEQRVHTTVKALQEVFGAMPRSRVARIDPQLLYPVQYRSERFCPFDDQKEIRNHRGGNMQAAPVKAQ